MKLLISKYAAIMVLLIFAICGSFAIPRRDLRAIGQVAGFALDEEDGTLKATFELYDPSLDEPIGRSRRIIVSEGNSIEECIENARLTVGENLFVNDASVLVLSSKNHSFLVQKTIEHYQLLKNDQMDLPVFFAFGQDAGEIFDGEGAVLSADLAKSGKLLNKVQTIRDLMNGKGNRVLIRGEGEYEIIP